MKKYLEVRRILRLWQAMSTLSSILPNAAGSVFRLSRIWLKNMPGRSQLQKDHPHKLRSTYGTALYQETGDIYLVADVLGHKDVNTTKKHYAALDDARRRQAAQGGTSSRGLMNNGTAEQLDSFDMHCI